MSSFEQYKSAYEQASYYIPEPGFDLRIEEFHKDFFEFLKENNIKQWAMVSAYNPGSKKCAQIENEAAHNRLRVLLSREGYEFRKAVHRDPNGKWPIERSFFIANIELKNAIALAKKFKQNAIVAGNINAVPHLFDCTQ